MSREEKLVEESLSTLKFTLQHRGVPEKPFAVIQATAYKMGCNPTAVIEMMINLKLSRIANNVSIQDSWLDIAGYAILAHAMVGDIDG